MSKPLENNLGYNVHNVCLVNGSHPLAAGLLGIMERITRDAFRGVPGDELDGLHDAIYDLQKDGTKGQDQISKRDKKTQNASKTNLVFDTRILSFGILPNENRVHVVVWCLEPLDGNARSDVGKQVERPS